MNCRTPVEETLTVTLLVHLLPSLFVRTALALEKNPLSPGLESAFAASDNGGIPSVIADFLETGVLPERPDRAKGKHNGSGGGGGGGGGGADSSADTSTYTSSTYSASSTSSGSSGSSSSASSSS